MNNQKRKLFNIACKVEKLLYEFGNTNEFTKFIYYNRMIINTNRKELEWDFIEPFSDLMKKDEISFSIFTEEDAYIKIKICI